MTDNKRERMLSEPIPRLVTRLAVPTIISMLVTTFYNMVDTYFVGLLNSPSATGAVGVAFGYMAFVQAIGFFFGQGSGNCIARLLGAGDRQKADEMASSGFLYALCGGVLIAVAGALWLTPLCRMLGATDTILPYAKDYLFYILIGTPYMVASFVLNNQMRFQGGALFSMFGIVSGAVVNIALDPLLMFTFGMGIGGAALATIISQAVGIVVLLIGTFRGDNIRLSIRNVRVKAWIFKEILRGGIPSLFRQGLASISAVCLNLVAGGLAGDIAIAAMSIVSRIMMFANSAMIGFGQGMQPVSGFNYGAGRYDRVREAFWFCVRYALLALALIAAAGFVFAEPLAHLFQKDSEVVRVATLALRFQCISFVGNAFIVPANMMLQSVGKTVPASLLAAARQGIMFLPALYLLAHFFGIMGLAMAQTVADVLSLLLSIPLALHFLHTIKENPKQPSEQH